MKRNFSHANYYNEKGGGRCEAGSLLEYVAMHRPVLLQGILFTRRSSWRQETFCQKYPAQNIVGAKYLIALAPPTEARVAKGCGEKV